MPSLDLDAGFLRELEALRRRLEIRARSGASGERTSRRRGSSSEFEDHRPYAPGDDPRRIDWSVYARTGEPFLKLFRAEEDVTARVLLDGSASMAFGTPAKVDHAKRFAAAIAYMTLSGLERAQLFAGSDGRVRTHTPVRGRGGAATFFREVASVSPLGALDLARSVDTVVRQSGRPGLLVVMSDFFDGGPVLSALARARAAGHDLAIVQILAPEEVQPELEGDLALEDSETGDTVELTADADSLDAYLARLAGLCAELRNFARRHGATYVRSVTNESLYEGVRRFVSRARD
jgi:uncharacterized protein (DUF58 family)